MLNSILTSIKKLLGITEGYVQYDTDIIIGINSALSILCQVGVGPSNGFSIKDASAVWSDLLSDDTTLEFVKTYIYMKVRLFFDPPTSSAMIESANKQLDELLWRISVAVDLNKKTSEEEIQNGE